MDVDQGHARLPAASLSSAKVKPLHVRKESSQIHLSQGQLLTNNDSLQNNPEKFVCQPSVRSCEEYCDTTTVQPYLTRTKTPSVALESEESLVSISYQNHPSFYRSIAAPSIATDTARSTLSGGKSSYLSDTSHSIMGDFVPIDSPNMASLQSQTIATNFSVQRSARGAQVNRNPYEFEPPSPHDDPSRQTTFTDFIEQAQKVEPILTPHRMHAKNSHSEGNVVYMTQYPTHVAATPTKTNRYGLYRSESSPTVSQLPFPSRREPTPITGALQYYAETREPGSLVHRGRQSSQEYSPHDGQDARRKFASRSPHRLPQDHAQEFRSHSPTHSSPRGSFSRGTIVNRNMTRSPTKTLDDVYERDEFHDNLPSGSSTSPPASPPMKRSRSPMKKMFGDRGWLGQSPDERHDSKLKSKETFVTHMDFSQRPKKISMIGKLKNKFEEIAEKADLSPIGRSRSSSDKHKLSVLSISLGPPEQARIYMEIELMLVHTANNFLMTQFSQGRMEVDSIKKTVDSWKNKGRPVVIEFMYDQSTQRDLVAANQQNFRFHGDKAGNDIRIDAMLYNWKQVANLMGIRTFCNADTVILKLLFDIEQILELLGTVEPMMIRLQQIRATATEIMRVARQKKDKKPNSHHSSRGREHPRDIESSASSTLHSMDDLYGGLKLVPDTYEE